MEDTFTRKYGTGIDNIKVVENYFSDDQCQEAIELIKQFDIMPNRKHLYSIDLSPNYYDHDEKIMSYCNKVSDSLTEYAESLWGQKLNIHKHAYLTIHPEGSSLHPHTDILDLHYPETDPDNNLPYFYLGEEKIEIPNSMQAQSEIFPNMWSGHLSTIVYLNDDYDGGEIYFPRLNYSIKPKRGMLISFPGSLYYIHGVKENLAGNRYTITHWAFFDFLSGHSINIEKVKEYRK